MKSMHMQHTEHERERPKWNIWKGVVIYDASKILFQEIHCIPFISVSFSRDFNFIYCYDACESEKKEKNIWENMPENMCYKKVKRNNM